MKERLHITINGRIMYLPLINEEYGKEMTKEKQEKIKEMYKKANYQAGSIDLDNDQEGELLETKLERMRDQNEPIGDEGVMQTYTERRDGVLPATNIRADKWDIAIDAMDVHEKSRSAEREHNHKNKDDKDESKVIDLNAKDESTQGTDSSGKDQ